MRSVVKKLWCCGAKSFPSRALPEEGRVRVYVGSNKETQCKLEMEANFLNHPLFEDLLRLSEEEFGHSYDGALRLSCELHVFQHLVQLLKSSNPSAHYLDVYDLISKYCSECNDGSTAQRLLSSSS